MEELIANVLELALLVPVEETAVKMAAEPNTQTQNHTTMLAVLAWSRAIEIDYNRLRSFLSMIMLITLSIAGEGPS